MRIIRNYGLEFIVINYRFLDKLCLDFTSTHAAKNFGYYRDLAQREHVAIIHHGRPSVVMMSADEYCRLMFIEELEKDYEKHMAPRIKRQNKKQKVK